MPAEGIEKMMSNKQLWVIDGNKCLGWMTYTSKVANKDYSRYDSLVSDNEPVKDVHYNVNLMHAEELE